MDNPAVTPAGDLRYDVGIVINENIEIGLNTRKIDDGKYAIFEVAHTEQGVMDFWKNMEQLTADLPVDDGKPILERYAQNKIANHQCEFCIPLK